MSSRLPIGVATTERVPDIVTGRGCLLPTVIVPLPDGRSPSSATERRQSQFMHPSEPFPHFVDDFLAYLQEVLPTQASFDGVHLHDDLLEDLSRPGVESHVRTLAGFSR